MGIVVSKNQWINVAMVALAICFIVFSSNYFDEYSVRILNNIAIFIILAVSYNLINGVTGQFSLEPNGFVAIGAVHKNANAIFCQQQCAEHKPRQVFAFSRAGRPI